VKFLVDMPVTPEAVEHLRRGGHEAVHASSVGLASVSDAEILGVALRERRIVVTADLDYPRLLALAGAEGPGVILFRGGSYSDQEMLNLLDRALVTVTGTELERSITVVDRKRIRRRRLPIS
jgi:predicted nuclease of predicted toxin-antitoxin system